MVLPRLSQEYSCDSAGKASPAVTPHLQFNEGPALLLKTSGLFVHTTSTPISQSVYMIAAPYSTMRTKPGNHTITPSPLRCASSTCSVVTLSAHKCTLSAFKCPSFEFARAARNLAIMRHEKELIRVRPAIRLRALLQFAAVAPGRRRVSGCQAACTSARRVSPPWQLPTTHTEIESQPQPRCIPRQNDFCPHA